MQTDLTESDTVPVHGIVHRGVVENYVNGIATVRVIYDTEGGCAACGARDGCGLAASGGGKPVAQVDIPYDTVLQTGQKVSVMLGRNSDWKATFFAFFLPIIMMASGLAIGWAVKLPEMMTALLSLGLLVSYGLILFLFRSRLNKTFSMTIISVE